MIPVAHGLGLGKYFTEERSLEELNANDQILFRYGNATGEWNDPSISRDRCLMLQE
jgi:phosphoribosylformylglycinamidine (FGAM) synthase-like amidotransferase family enzyme